MTQVSNGSCHCGGVRFRFDERPQQALDCNCSICSKKRFVHLIVPKTAFTLLSDESNISTYRFGTKTARHTFCKTCGVTAFYYPRSHPDSVSVNARCVEGLDLSALEIVPFDGQNWERARAELQDAAK